MKFPSELITQLWWEPLRTVKTDRQTSCKEWLEAGFYSVDRCSATEFEIILPMDQSWAHCVASEFNTWTTASFETMNSLAAEGSQPRATAWILIQAYYASYFAAHSLLRIFGGSFTNLESNHVAGIFKSAQASGLASITRPECGNYNIKLDTSLGRITCTKRKESHADLWNSFYGLTREIEQRIQNLNALSSHQLEAVDFMDKLSSALTNYGLSPAGNWLSTQRNLINYRKALGVWYPYEKNNPLFCDTLIKMERWVKKDPLYSISQTDSDLNKITETTNIVVWLARAFVKDIDSKRKFSQSFIDKGVLEYLKLSRISV